MLQLLKKSFANYFLQWFAFFIIEIIILKCLTLNFYDSSATFASDNWCGSFIGILYVFSIWKTCLKVCMKFFFCFLCFVSTSKKKIHSLEMPKIMLIFSILVITIYIQNNQNFFKMITIIGVKRLLLFASENNRFHDAKSLKPGYRYRYNQCSLYFDVFTQKPYYLGNQNTEIMGYHWSDQLVYGYYGR